MRSSAYRMKLPNWATRLVQVLVVLLIVYALMRLTGFNIIVEGATDMTADDPTLQAIKKEAEKATANAAKNHSKASATKA